MGLWICIEKMVYCVEGLHNLHANRFSTLLRICDTPMLFVRSAAFVCRLPRVHYIVRDLTILLEIIIDIPDLSLIILLTIVSRNLVTMFALSLYVTRRTALVTNPCVLA